MSDLQRPRHTSTLPFSPIRYVVSHRLQSADTGPLIDADVAAPDCGRPSKSGPVLPVLHEKAALI